MYGHLVALATPVVSGIIAYLKSEAAIRKGSESAVGAIGTKAGQELVHLGGKGISLLKGVFIAKNDAKAVRALQNAEEDPEDSDYADKLLKETARLAAADPDFALQLTRLGREFSSAPQGGATLHIQNTASNYGQQGVFNGPVYGPGQPPRDGRD
jgi:hypothetical protein